MLAFVLGMAPDTGALRMAWELVARMSLEEKVGQLVVSYPPSPGFAAAHGISGVVLNQHHIKNPRAIRAKTQAYNRASAIPMILAADQEGGRVNRLKYIPGFQNTPSPLELGEWPLDSVYGYARRTAETMRSLGLNANLAPCLDVSRGQRALMRRMRRTFGGDHRAVLRVAEAYIRGMRDGGVLVFAKHFPGYGEARGNSDVTLVKYNPPAHRLILDLLVFARMAPLLDGVMMSSLVYLPLDTVPGVLSPKVVGLAHWIDPWLVVMTDDLWAPALREWVRPDYKESFRDRDLAKIARAAFLAGCDLLLILYDAKVPVIERAILDLVRSRPELEARLDSSVVRVLLAKDRAYPGLLSSMLQEGPELPDAGHR